ncbi:MAG: GNAT family N-acetyltransferase [Phycisphaerales bacterium]|nr:GNAT family N-acetyltransferase [Phycisphaerales bacterium]
MRERTFEKTRDEFQISTDRSRIDARAVQAFLQRSYWAAGIPLETVRRSIEHSICFGVYHDDRLVGFARVITDRATFAYLGDVFIDEPLRGLGLSKWLVATILEHPELQGLRRWLLVTRDAHDLYRRFGFTDLEHPANYLAIVNPDLYKVSGT